MAKYANPEPRGQSFRETRWRDSLRLRLPAHALHLATVGVSTSGGSAYRLAAAILRLRVPIGIGLISISLFMALGVTKVQIATSFTDFFPTAHANVMLYEEFRAKFGGAQSVTIAIHVKKGDIFQPATLKRSRTSMQGWTLFRALTMYRLFLLPLTAFHTSSRFLEA